MVRSKSSRRWLRRHREDEFVQRAHKEDRRSRAAYKLAEIDARDRLFRPGMTVVDLGAAPGGWSQYAAQCLAGRGRIIAVDILPMEPIPGVEFIQGDFTENAMLDLLLKRLSGRTVDLVMSDMAPHISGIGAVDQARASELAELVLDFAAKTLRPGGNLLLKVFQGEGYAELRRRIQTSFGNVFTRKPRASRSESREMYLLGKGFREA